MLPDYIDNSHHTLQNVLETIIKDERQLTLDIATGFFRIEAWVRLETAMNQLTGFRLLLGRDPTIRPGESDRIDLIRYFKKELYKEIDEKPLLSEYQQQIERLIAYLQRDDVQVRLFGEHGEKQFLHAKAYIFDNYSIVGSSNFTPAGLEGNTELNIINKIGAIAQDLRHNWFENFWKDPSVDLDYKAKLIDALNASKFGSKAYTPYQIFLKVLYELFKDDTIIGQGSTLLELASFQQEGFERAVKLIEKHRGCMIADAVGLGKTFIGLRLIEHYLIKLRKPGGSVPRALVICPAQLRDLVWHKKLDDFGIKADIVSHEEISRDHFDISRYNRHDIVVVDESHNFRNSATNRYRNLLKLVNSGKRSKRIALLTATPINTSIYDLYHQILLLTRGSETYYREWEISNLKTYFKALSKGGIEITELLMQTMVRRSRQDVIRRQAAGEEIRINGKLIKFPKRQLENFTYSFESNFAGLYANIGNQIDNLTLSPYNLKLFKKKKQKDDEYQIKRSDALVALQKSLYLKRFESSLIAFKRSITNQRNFQSKFYEILTQKGKLLDSKNFRNLLLVIEDEDENTTVNDIIESLEEIDITSYDINQLEHQIKVDLAILNNIIDVLNKIENSAADHVDYDRKLIAFKELLKNQLSGQKILVFSYFKDTANYLHQELKKDIAWLSAMAVDGHEPVIKLLTGDSPGKLREETVKHFSPKANAQDTEELATLLENQIDILICTDVLSEGQNLQDAGVLVNYDLHWNPVRMIQRAGRIDRLGTDYEELFIYNCFPEQGLEDLLNLVGRLQERIANIDREVGLDGSVLGEIISEKSLEELYRLKMAETDAEKQAILEELELVSDLVSLDEMRLPLLEFLQQASKELIEDIPFGIHSTSTKNITHPDINDGGIFFAFRTGDKNFWHFYPRIQGVISLDPSRLISDKRTIFNWLKCQESDFPNPDELLPVPFDNRIFGVLDRAVNNLLTSLQKQQTAKGFKPAMTKLLQSIYHAITNPDSIPDVIQSEPIEEEVKQQVLKVITTVNYRSYERDVRKIWESFKSHKDISLLISELDNYFVESDQYEELTDDQDIRPAEIIEQKDIKLICYQWFKPDS
ncbi:SNF2-related protein [Anabaena sp. UHCC 0451]|uniref:SNF2-related protein n=1 Tax=Anabaena sp. UHCC 0451 TaxID=2055235 RepID=UPI002B1EA7E5|nr:SNF2-related protein [Anabaena sp. UHCC 0451]MEA5578686.1 SNF2-related protein [Anabaena sp. UHCC 0451]